MGKEKRKVKPSAEGKLGVEGVEKKIILKAFENAGITASESSDNSIPEITKTDLYMLGLSGGNNSSILRKKLLAYLKLPSLLSANSMLEVLNTMISYDELKEIMDKIQSRG